MANQDAIPPNNGIPYTNDRAELLHKARDQSATVADEGVSATPVATVDEPPIETAAPVFADDIVPEHLAAPLKEPVETAALVSGDEVERTGSEVPTATVAQKPAQTAIPEEHVRYTGIQNVSAAEPATSKTLKITDSPKTPKKAGWNAACRACGSDGRVRVRKKIRAAGAGNRLEKPKLFSAAWRTEKVESFKAWRKNTFSSKTTPALEEAATKGERVAETVKRPSFLKQFFMRNRDVPPLYPEASVTETVEKIAEKAIEGNWAQRNKGALLLGTAGALAAGGWAAHVNSQKTATAMQDNGMSM